MYDDERYLIPDLFPKQQPAFAWDGADTLGFQYHYVVLPGSVISRFIVSMHDCIHADTYWRTGVMLAYQNGRNTALVRADLQDGKVFISVAGNPATRRDFLSMIRAQFERIHRSIARMDVTEMVPIPGHPDVLRDYQDLLTLEEASELSYFVPKLKQRINVRELLDGVRPAGRRM
jgi:internalin A